MKVLVIRFSSLGDLFHLMPAVNAIKKSPNGTEIHWVTRSDMADIVQSNTSVDRVWSYDRKTGLKGLMVMAKQLRAEGFTHIYDAHNNLRSHLLCFLLWPCHKRWSSKFVRRSKERSKRWLLFKFGWNLFPKPYRSADSFRKPVEKWSPSGKAAKPCTEPPLLDRVREASAKSSVVIAPSAAWPLKRWPLEYWKQLVQKMPDVQFLILGGPEDRMCEEIHQSSSDNTINWAGQLSWRESYDCVRLSRAVVSGDTGIMHMADYEGRPTLALMGPTAFGFPSHPHSVSLEHSLPCRPCSKDGRGKCSNSVYQKCMKLITVEEVIQNLRQILNQK